MHNSVNEKLLVIMRGYFSGAFAIARKGGSWDFCHVGPGILSMIAGGATPIGTKTESVLLTVPLGLGEMPSAAVTASSTSSLTRMTTTR